MFKSLSAVSILPAFLAVVFLTAPQEVQAQRSFQVGVSAGLGVPTGDLADVQESGYHIGGHLNFAPASLPVELLLDVTYHNFSGNSDVVFPVDFSYLSVSGNAAYVFSGLGIRPYLMGGIGMYFGKADVEGAESESDFGFDVGGGLRFMLSGFSSFLQARVNFVGDATFIPISFGVLF